MDRDTGQVCVTYSRLVCRWSVVSSVSVCAPDAWWCISACVCAAADACLFRLTADDTESDGGCGGFLRYCIIAVCRICLYSTVKDQLSLCDHVLHIARGDNEISYHIPSQDLVIIASWDVGLTTGFF